MKKVFGQYSNFLFGLISLVAFLFTNIKLEYRLILFLMMATVYYIGLSIHLNKKYNFTKDDIKEKQRLVQEAEKKNSAYVDFCNKRKLFRMHDLPRIQKIKSDQYAFLRDRHRGKKYDPIFSDIGALDNEIDKITNKEMRDFDEQLYDLPNHKDN